MSAKKAGLVLAMLLIAVAILSVCQTAAPAEAADT
jgi:hypothetical protein